jgi:hypothetical protein
MVEGTPKVTHLIPPFGGDEQRRVQLEKAEGETRQLIGRV